ncbi:hypothetical protein [Buchnera aphidicola]|uniref:hypothetical protein n=1 Tax=Buchnera aphidicola TaxID=9 RepID=UPI0005C47D71|nr:hypothetical protein [Buchnera aphidicola]
MYNFFLVMCVVIDILLILLIMIQSRIYGYSSSSFSTIGNKQISISFSSQNTLIYIIAILSGLFFLMSLIISNINYHKSYNNRIVTYDQKIFSSTN